MSTEEQRTIVAKMIVGSARYKARRKGYPEPEIVEVTVRDLPGGGYEKVEGSERPLRPEWDPRTTRTPSKRAKTPLSRSPCVRPS
jgi:hypothetical protein